MLLSSFKKNGLCSTLLFAHVFEVATPTLKSHLNAPQEVGAHPLRGVCWHFTHVVLDAETQFLQATGLVAVSSGLLTVLKSTRWTIGFGGLQEQQKPELKLAGRLVAWMSCVSASSRQQ